MFTQPASSPSTLAASNPQVSPASPHRPSRLRGLSYLRSYTHSHLHSRENNNEAQTSPRRYNLTRATSYPSPTLSSAGNTQGESTTPLVQSPNHPVSPSTQRSTAEQETAASQENTVPTGGWLPTVEGQSGVSRIASLPQSTPTDSSSAILNGLDTVENSSLQAAMGRTRSATTGRVSGSDVPELNDGRDTQIPYGSVPIQTMTGVYLTENGSQLPSIRFSQHQDVRAPRPSLVFSSMSRTLPTGKETIRVGRYSERENQPSPASNVPSAAPIGFKSKVVSRRHCEFWYQDGQWFIKDVKSSSGTFLNHVRLSSPGTESKPYPVKDGDIVQLGIDFKGGEEMIFRCVKIRIELNRGWQNALNSFNVASHKRLRNMAKQNPSPAGASSSQDCTICLGAVAPCQSLFVAPCSHTWHYKCVRRIINGPMYPQFICPNCRAVADLDADVDDPFPDGEWEEIGAIDAEEEQRVESSAKVANPATSQQIPTIIARPDTNTGNPISRVPTRDTSRENIGDDTTGSESELHQAMNYLEISSRENSTTSLPPESHSAVAPMNIRSARSPSRRDGSNMRVSDSNAEHVSRGARTPSPSARIAPRGGDVLSAPDGPMTPRNDAGPFVFDGSAGRPSQEGMPRLSLAAATEVS